MDGSMGTWEYEGKIEPNEQGGGMGSFREGPSEKGTFKLGMEGYVGLHQEHRGSSMYKGSPPPSPPAPEK